MWWWIVKMVLLSTLSQATWNHSWCTFERKEINRKKIIRIRMKKGRWVKESRLFDIANTLLGSWLMSSCVNKFTTSDVIMCVVCIFCVPFAFWSPGLFVTKTRSGRRMYDLLFCSLFSIQCVVCHLPAMSLLLSRVWLMHLLMQYFDIIPSSVSRSLTVYQYHLPLGMYVTLCVQRMYVSVPFASVFLFRHFLYIQVFACFCNRLSFPFQTVLMFFSNFRHVVHAVVVVSACYVSILDFSCCCSLCRRSPHLLFSVDVMSMHLRSQERHKDDGICKWLRAKCTLGAEKDAKKLWQKSDSVQASRCKKSDAQKWSDSASQQEEEEGSQMQRRRKQRPRVSDVFAFATLFPVKTWGNYSREEGESLWLSCHAIIPRIHMYILDSSFLASSCQLSLSTKTETVDSESSITDDDEKEREGGVEGGCLTTLFEKNYCCCTHIIK